MSDKSDPPDELHSAGDTGVGDADTVDPGDVDTIDAGDTDAIDTGDTDAIDAGDADTVEGDTTLAALSHASALVASFLGPLLLLILADDGDELVERNAKNSLNFQILVFGAIMVSGLLTFVFIGILLFPLIAVIDVVLILIATLKANDGEVYSYPYTPDLL